MSTPLIRVAITALIFNLVTPAANAGTPCDSSLSASLQDAGRIVRAMRVDKPGQARVFARDGSEHTAGAVRWISAELEIASRACAQGDEADAVRHLDAVRAVLKLR